MNIHPLVTQINNLGIPCTEQDLMSLADDGCDTTNVIAKIFNLTTEQIEQIGNRDRLIEYLSSKNENPLRQ